MRQLTFLRLFRYVFFAVSAWIYLGASSYVSFSKLLNEFRLNLKKRRPKGEREGERWRERESENKSANLVGRRHRKYKVSSRKMCIARGHLPLHYRPGGRCCRTCWGREWWRESWPRERATGAGWRASEMCPSRPSCRLASWWTPCNWCF